MKAKKRQASKLVAWIDIFWPKDTKNAIYHFSAGYAYAFSLVRIQIFLQLEGNLSRKWRFFNQVLVDDANSW